MISGTSFSGLHVAVAFLIGAGVGVGVALLAAPKSGRETRQQLGRLVRRSRERLSEASEALRESFQQGREAVQAQPEHR